MRFVVAVLLLIVIVGGGGYVLLHAGIYGWTLFVLAPVFIGGVISWACRPQSAGEAAALGALAAGIAPFFLLIVALEGIVCIAMALPLIVPLGAFGGWLAYKMEFTDAPERGITAMLLLPLATLTWDIKAPPSVFAVHTQIIVQAPPAQVWKHVIAFPQLPEPQEWFFHTGLAYPIRARIDGSGPGAVRYCDFTTGAFVEPIEVWDAPRLLRFRVTDNPAPLREWNPFSEVEPRHLHGYLMSKRGQFRLTPLANGRTLLEGTTWYQHGLWPAQYWRWWSDAIIHRIHLRVLNHVRMLAEQEAEHT